MGQEDDGSRNYVVPDCRHSGWSGEVRKLWRAREVTPWKRWDDIAAVLRPRGEWICLSLVRLQSICITGNKPAIRAECLHVFCIREDQFRLPAGTRNVIWFGDLAARCAPPEPPPSCAAPTSPSPLSHLVQVASAVHRPTKYWQWTFYYFPLCFCFASEILPCLF